MRRQLATLDAHLHAARRPPGAAALQALLLFSHQEELGAEGFDVEGRLAAELPEVSRALAGIREFNGRIPTTPLVRLVSGDVDYTPKRLGGREDWFLLFRRFWSARADEGLSRYLRAREHRRVEEQALAFLEIHRLPRVGSEGLPGGAAQAVARWSLALGFILGFYEAVIFRLARPMLLIAEKGRFFREENRRELAESLGFLDTVDERLDELLQALRTSPEYGAPAASSAAGSTAAPPGAAPGAAAPEPAGADSAGGGDRERAEKALLVFLDECAANMRILGYVLEGLLRGTPGERYDTVVNLDELGEWQGRMLPEVLEEAFDHVTEALSLLGRIRALEPQG